MTNLSRAPAHVKPTPSNLRRRYRRHSACFPVAEEALNAYVTGEFESPRLVANAHLITVDGHVVATDVE